MYFDSTSFKKSLRVYIEPLGRIIQESLYEIPEKLAGARESCLESWTTSKPRSIGGALAYIAFAPLLLVLLLLATLWFAFHNPDSNEPGWLSIGLLLSLYALSVPIAILWLTLFNIKYGRLATS